MKINIVPKSAGIIAKGMVHTLFINGEIIHPRSGKVGLNSAGTYEEGQKQKTKINFSLQISRGITTDNFHSKIFPHTSNFGVSIFDK